MMCFLRAWLLAVLFILSTPSSFAQTAVEPPAEPVVTEEPAPNAPVSDEVGIVPVPEDVFVDSGQVYIPPPPVAFPSGSMVSGSFRLPTAESINFAELSSRVRDTSEESGNFNALRSLRNRVGAALERVRSELFQAEQNKIYLSPSRDIVEWIELDRADLQCAESPDCDRLGPESINSIKNNLRRGEADLELARAAEEGIPVAKDLLQDLERLADELDRKINDALNRDLREQDFKTSVSLYFTGIVGVMIVLFFGLLFYDAKVRTALFSSPSAIQFVTLFSVVIAIILFGITGILQDKELSALLGGLSGYILGRYSNDTPATT